MFLNLFLLCLTGYIVGGIPTSYILARLLKEVDIRTYGSGNSGATNASRLLGFPFFFIILLIDAGKAYGVLAVAQNVLIGGDNSGLLWCAGSVLVGNGFSPFLGLYGGKGVATGIGLLLALLPLQYVLYYVLSFLLMLAISRRIDVAGLSAVVVGAASVWYGYGAVGITLFVWLLALWIWGRHWQNIFYLLGKNNEF